MPDLSGARAWDATTYDRISDAQRQWGRRVLDRLELVGHETVLDAGCGSGQVTGELLARLPHGRVIALDLSPEMLAEARTRLGSDPRVEFVEADLAKPLPIPEPVDAILSTTVFHLVPDHDALFRNLAAVLRPGGQLVAQCGGWGCIRKVLDAVESAGIGWRGPWVYATPEETRARLEEAGFTDVQTWLHDEPTRYERGGPLETFLGSVVLRPYAERVPADRWDSFIRSVADRLPDGTIDFVRLNIVARRAAPGATPAAGTRQES
jgi:trans-aconitate 2-methyltransferase